MENPDNSKSFTATLSTKIRQTAIQLASNEHSRILDVCCGTGLLFTQNQPRLSHSMCVGVDLSEHYISNTSGTDHYLLADACELPFEAKTFDLIFCLNTLINFKTLNQIRTLLQELRRIRNDRGTIVIDIRNHRNPLLRLSYAIHAMQYSFPVKGYRLAEMIRLIESVKLNIARQIAVKSPVPGMPWAYVLKLSS